MTRVAPAAQSILDQATSLWPRRSRLSDGTIGDAAHSSRTSDHNPDSRGIVHAADLTHDPGDGCDAHAMADRARQRAKEGKEPRLKYVISNRRIASASSGWNWTYYSGSNPHTQHAHFSVNSGSIENSTAPWFESEPKPLTRQQKRAILAAARRSVARHPRPPLRFSVPNMRGDYVRSVQHALNLPITGKYGVGTYNGVRRLQRAVGLPVTGKVNQETWIWLIYYQLVKVWEGDD